MLADQMTVAVSRTCDQWYAQDDRCPGVAGPALDRRHYQNEEAGV